MSKKSTSVLAQYLKNINNLNPYEFEDMVAELFRVQGWTNVKVTSRSNDKGRDVIGINPEGKKVYIEVKKYSKNIGRPIIQKLHSIMINEGVEYGCVVTTSGFSKTAIDYANETNIKLINGRKFISLCNKHVKGIPDIFSLAKKIDVESIKEDGRSILDKMIFSYPESTSKFVNESIFSDFLYEPHHVIEFSLNQTFQNSTGSWSRTMVYDEDCIEQFLDGSTKIHDDFPFLEVDNIEVVMDYLQKNKHVAKKIEAPRELTVNDMKKIVQSGTMKNLRYRGLNNQVYTIECKPSLKKIQILDNKIIWAFKNSLKMNLNEYLSFKIDLLNDKLEGVTVSSKNIHEEHSKEKEIYLCQDCKNLIFKGLIRKNFHNCRQCGKVICKNCSQVKRFLYFFKRKWCLECFEKLENGTISDEKNNREINKAKVSYNTWKQNKMSPYLKFN